MKKNPTIFFANQATVEKRISPLRVEDDGSLGPDSRQLLQHTHVGIIQQPEHVLVVILLIPHLPRLLLLQGVERDRRGRLHHAQSRAPPQARGVAVGGGGGDGSSHRAQLGLEHRGPADGPLGPVEVGRGLEGEQGAAGVNAQGSLHVQHRGTLVLKKREKKKKFLKVRG